MRGFISLSMAAEFTRARTNDGSRRAVLWTWELSSGIATRLTSTGDADWPVPSPDGKTIALSRGRSSKSQIFSISADGSGSLTPLYKGTDEVAEAFTPDGKWLAVFNSGYPGHTIARSIAQGGETKAIGLQDFTVMTTDFSPDGHWVAYTSNESGTFRSLRPVLPRPRPEASCFIRGRLRSGMVARWARDLLYCRGLKALLGPNDGGVVFACHGFGERRQTAFRR